MKSFGFDVDIEKFQQNTPIGNVNFANVIATYPKNPPNQYLNKYTKDRYVFACHYDSKYYKGQNFIGAIDSAVPCAMLIDMAKFIYENIEKTNQKINHQIQFIFFDGEEAFVDWTINDSIYGARHHAKMLSQNFQANGFNSMKLFILLDLIGADVTKFPNYFQNNAVSNSAYVTLARTGLLIYYID
jgi:glutaminyl-peptide cyclotransferase